MVRLSVGVEQMVVVVGMVLILLVVVVVANGESGGIAGECKGGVAVAVSVWKSWAISGSFC